MTPKELRGGITYCISLFLTGSLAIIGFQLRQDQLDNSLIKAVKSVDAPTIQSLLAEGANANARDAQRPPLEPAGLVARLRAWLQGRPTPVTANAGAPALVVLLQDTNLLRKVHLRKSLPVYDSIACALVEHGANINVRCRHVDPLEEVEGVDLGVHFSEATPLHIAIMYRLKPTVNLLLSHGADVSVRNGVGRTPLSYADVDMAVLLLQYGADVNAIGDGESRLARAVTCCHLELVKVLIRYGANVNIPDGDGHSMLYRAEHCYSLERPELVKLLRKHGARLMRKEIEAGAKR